MTDILMKIQCWACKQWNTIKNDHREPWLYCANCKKKLAP